MTNTIGQREYSVLAHLLAKPESLDAVAARLQPIDLAWNETTIGDKDDMPGGQFRLSAFDGMQKLRQRGEAITPERLAALLGSADNYYGRPVGERHLRTFMARIGGGAVDDFDAIVNELAADAAKRREVDVASQPAIDDVDCQSESVPMAHLASCRAESQYLIPGVLATLQPTLGVGPVKCGKTSILGVELGVSLATGTPFLNHFVVPARRCVLLLSGESGKSTLADTFRRVCAAKNIDPASVDDFEFSTWLPQFSVARDLAELGRRIDDAGAAVVITDPAGVCMSPNAASMLGVAYAELRAMSDVCLSRGATPILLHHATKGSSVSRQGLLAAAGAGFAEWARGWLLLDRIGQFKPDTGEHRLRLTAGGSRGHAGEYVIDWREGSQNDPGGRTWDVSVSPIGKASSGKASKSFTANVAKVLAAVKALTPAGEFHTAKAIRDGASVSGKVAAAAIANLVDAGALLEKTIVRGGQDWMGYAVASDASAA